MCNAPWNRLAFIKQLSKDASVSHSHSVFCSDYSRMPVEEDQGGMIRTLHAAYRIGRSQPRSSSGEQWRLQLQNSLSTSTWEKDQPILVRCGQYLNKARASAAGGENQAACVSFLQARLWAESEDLSAEGRLRAQIEISANKAYIEYCFGNFEGARRSLLATMKAGQHSEEASKSHHIHRIHLVNNMIKVEAAAQNLNRAMELAASVFLYLEQKTDTLPVEGDWGSSYFQETSSEAIRFLKLQTSGEIAVALAGLAPSEVRKALQVLSSHIDIRELHDSWLPEMSTWLNLKFLMTDEARHSAYLAGCIPYFSQGPGCAAGLWYLTALDVAAVCQPFRDSEALLLKREIIADLRAMQHFPRRVRGVVSRLAATLGETDSSAQVQSE